jgi:spermidine/putrescine transport system substrate-binding protein
MILSGSLMFASACTRPGSSSAPQRFGTGLSGPNVQVLDRQIMLTVPPGAVDPATISSFKDALGVGVTVVDGELDGLTDVGRADVALTDDVTLTALITRKLVEPLDRSLVANTKLLLTPFDSPPYDRGNRHSVPKDYVTAGFAVAPAALTAPPPSTWAEFFHLARTFPGRVAVPPERDIVIGGALLAAGHDWNSSSTSDMTDAADILLPIREDLVIQGSMLRHKLPPPLVAALCDGTGMASPPPGVQFVVPSDGTLARARCYCIPTYAPDPVSAHAWLNHSLEPAIAAAETRYTRHATPVGPAVYELPTRLVANPAVFPPALPPTPLVFASLDPSGETQRTQLWDDLTAPRARPTGPR